MNYTLLYEQLIETRKILQRKKNNDGLLENHHIIPKSLGGENFGENLILLTPREHYVAHWLLYKIHHGAAKAKMAYAFFMMCKSNDNQCRKLTSKQYARAKESMQTTCRGANHPMFGKSLWSDKQKSEISNRMKGKLNHRYGKVPWNFGLTKATSVKLKQLSVALKLKYANTPHPLLGFKHSEETKLKMSLSMSGISKTQDHRDKLSNALKGRILSEETKQKMSNAKKDVPQRVVICPHCNKSGGVSVMRRWHFDNCNFKN